jgi:hypothetical protein
MAGENQGLQDVVLHLPAALRDRAEEMASRESLSLNLFVLMAVAEKLQRLQLQYCLDLSERDEARSTAGPVGDSLVH